MSSDNNEIKHRAGFIAIVGRPNTGKSTLVNALVGSKVVITSHHPNTTRNAIRAIVSQPDYQLVLVDTPGVHKPKTMLGSRLNAMASESMDSVDVVAICLPANEEIGHGDLFIAKDMASQRSAKKIAILTKTDLVSNEGLPPKLLAIAKLAKDAGFAWDEVVPLSAKRGDQVALIMELFAKYSPESPSFYPEEMLSDQTLEHTIAEYIREAAIVDVFEEVPHSIMVVVDEMTERDKRVPNERPFYDIHATIHVERDSQKSIILGHKGERLKKVGTNARAEIERLVKGRIFLGLHVKVSANWQRDPKALGRMGFTE